MKMNEKSGVFVDVTDFVEMPRITGIQRLIRSGLANTRGLRFLYFSAVNGRFVELERLPEDRERAPVLQSPALSRVLALGYMCSIICYSVLTPAPHRSPRYSASFLKAMRTAYRALAGTTKSQGLSFSFKRVSEAEIKDIWCLDIPRKTNHLDALQSLSGRGTRLHFYVLDLLPLQREELWGEPNDPIQVAWYRQYLFLTTLAQTRWFLSRFTQQSYQRLVLKNEKDRVVYPPLRENNRFSIPGLSVGQLSPKLERERKGLLFVGPLNKRKNLLTVLKAIRLSERGLAAGLTIVCSMVSDFDPETVAELVKTKFRLRSGLKIHWHLSDRELRALYRRSAVLTLPSRGEGFGLPAIEAVASGCQVLVADSSSLSELGAMLQIEKVNPESAEDWADAIDRALQQSSSRVAVPRELPTAEEFHDAMISACGE